MNTTTWLCGPPPSTGQRQRYPSRFLYNLRKNYPEMAEGNVLHMFSGSCDFGTSTDFREETGADIIAPFDAIPKPDESFAHVLADPPYADHYQNQWHGGLPKPKHILKEAARLVSRGGADRHPAHHHHPRLQRVRRGEDCASSGVDGTEQRDTGVQRVQEDRG